MITKERLEELIGQCATIYTTYGGYISEINLHNKYDYVTDNYLFEADMVAGEVGYRKYPFNMLFEIKEEAEWYKEFGCIERTERLVLPTWEEMIKEPRCLDCWTKEFVVMENDIPIGKAFIGVDFDCEMVSVEMGSNQYFVEQLAKDNYIKACTIARKLFLGEKL